MSDVTPTACNSHTGNPVPGSPAGYEDMNSAEFANKMMALDGFSDALNKEENEKSSKSAEALVGPANQRLASAEMGDVAVTTSGVS